MEEVGRQVPADELSSPSWVVCAVAFSKMPLAIRGMSLTVVRVISDGGRDGRHVVFCRE